MVKKLFSTLFIIIAVLLLAGIGLIFLGKSQAGNAVSFFVEGKTDYPTDIEELDIQLLEGTVDLKKLNIANPDFFPNPTFINLEQFKADVNLASLLTMKRIS